MDKDLCWWFTDNIIQVTNKKTLWKYAAYNFDGWNTHDIRQKNIFKQEMTLARGGMKKNCDYAHSWEDFKMKWLL